MSWTQRSNEKRITELEKRVGIIKGYQKSDYWQELNSYASRAFLKERNNNKDISHSFTLPEHLRFASGIFDRLLEFYRKIYRKILSKKYKLPECRPGYKALIKGWGWVLPDSYGEIMMACVIRTLHMPDEVRKYFLEFMSEYALNTSAEVVKLGLV